MKTDRAANELETRAAEALKSLLEQVSAVKLKEMKRESASARPRCRNPGAYRHLRPQPYPGLRGECRRAPQQVRASIKKLQDCAAHLAGETTLVLIAPYLSPEAQALCKESHAGFLDLEGNARLSVGEVFIGKRSMRRACGRVNRSWRCGV